MNTSAVYCNFLKNRPVQTGHLLKLVRELNSIQNDFTASEANQCPKTNVKFKSTPEQTERLRTKMESTNLRQRRSRYYFRVDFCERVERIRGDIICVNVLFIKFNSL
jgi:hypothetical protein